MIYCFKKIFLVSIFILYVVLVGQTEAQTINVDANKLLPHVELYLSPRSGSFVEGSTFEVPIFINTKGQNVNGIEVKISFDKNKLSIVKQSSGTSIIGVWVEPPKYDNNSGIASYVGVVPGGIKTEAGMIGVITFKAISLGKATINFSSNSNVLLNDGLGTNTKIDFGKVDYFILGKSPEGVGVFSETHPFQNNWYNNKNPILSWDKENGVNGFSLELDNKPSTIPDNIIDTEDTTISFENIKDGLWYFHIKANKGGVWGNTGHFLVKIDTTPPAEFKPEVNYLLANTAFVDRTLISFYTSDNLSGIDHYEVGVINKKDSVTESPAFVQTESPYQVPLNDSDELRVIVRAIDGAGNIRDSYIDVSKPSIVSKFIKNNLVYILLFIIIAGFFGLIFHYIFGHHIIRNLKRVLDLLKKEESGDVLIDDKKEKDSEYQ